MAQNLELSLNSAESSGIETIKKILAESGFSADSLIVKRTTSYLTIELPGDYPFCRLKLSGDIFYISLCICDEGDIERLSLNPLYSPLKQSSTKFTRFEISGPEDISKFSDGVISAYCFIGRVPNPQSDNVIKACGVSPDLSEFLSMIKLYSKGSRQYNISDDEISFLGAYQSTLSENGLNWRDFRPYRTADGGIHICGGNIRLQGRKTYMIYFQDGELPPRRVDNKPLSEYISLQKHWVSFCLKNKELIPY